MNRMQAWSGMFAAAQVEGLVSPDYSVFHCTSGSVDYLQDLFRSPLYVNQFASASKGIGSGFNRLYTPDFGAISIEVPPIEEQVQIASFVRGFSRNVEKLIRAKRRVIELLNEQKQAIIHRAVTRGLDPEVRTRPSGYPWLGDIPAHWKALPLRRNWEVIDCKHLTVPFFDVGTPLASVRQVQSFELDLLNAKRTSSEWIRLLSDGGRKPRAGDIIYCRNVSVGACAIVITDEEFAMGQDVCLIRSRNENQRYLNYFLHGPAMQSQLALLLVGSTFKRINVADVKALGVVIPPRREQDEIVSHLDAQVLAFDSPIRATEREIAMLREYRTRLIADVVTGKLDVRGVALPEVSDGEEVGLGDESDDEDLAEADDGIEDEALQA